MWWYNILGDKETIVSHILRLDNNHEVSDLLTANLVYLKRENMRPF